MFACTDPSNSSVSVCQTGPLRIHAPIVLGAEGEEVHSEKKSLIFKHVHVRRIYDEENNALVYVGYSSRLGQDMKDQNSRSASNPYTAETLYQALNKNH